MTNPATVHGGTVPTRTNELTPDQWKHVETARAEWLAAGLDTAPADRPATETAITEMYRLIGRPAPQYVWVDSPAAAHLALWLLSGKPMESLKGQLGDQLGDQLWGQLGDQLRGQLGDQLRGQLWDQLRGQLGDQLRGQLGDQLWGQLGDQLRGQLGGQLRGQLGDQLRGQLGDQLRGQLGGQLWGQLWDQLRGQLRGQLGDQLRGQLGDQLRESVDRNLSRAFWGQQEAYWIAFYEVPRRLGIVTYDDETSRRLDLWATLARSTNWWWPYENIVVLSERPAVIHRDPQSRLHCADGPAVRFRDGWSLWSWHGTRVPQDLIENSWTTEQILSERNAEIRRCAIEKLGWDEFIRDSALELVASAPDPGNAPYYLALYDLPESLADMYEDSARILFCVNGTVEPDGSRRRFGLPVPAHHSDPIAAAADLYGWPVEAYRRLEVRR